MLRFMFAFILAFSIGSIVKAEVEMPECYPCGSNFSGPTFPPIDEEDLPGGTK